MVLIAVLIIVLGLVMIFKPDIVWEITESWKSTDATEPSDFYIWQTRLGGGFFVLVGAVSTAIFLFF